MARAAQPQTLIDTTSTANFIYIGTAMRSVPTSSAGWLIIGIDTSAAVFDVTIRTPVETDAGASIWDDRTTYTYG